mgnify:CR=1 FL=1
MRKNTPINGKKEMLVSLCCGLGCAPPNSYVEDLNPRVAILEFGDKTFKEAVKVKGGHNGGPLIQWDLCPYKKRRNVRKRHTQRKGHSGAQRKGDRLQERGLRRNQACLPLDFILLASRTVCEQTNSCLSLPVCDIFFYGSPSKLVYPPS